MSDWTDETRARLEKRSRAMTVSSADAWDKQTGADIRAALGEIERLIELVNGSVGWRTAQEQRERAESAEAVLDIASREIDRLTKKAESAEAEVERLRGLHLHPGNPRPTRTRRQEAQAMSSSLSAPHDVVPTRSRRLSPVRIEWADPLPTDCFAPAPAGCRCRDRAGRLRKRHSYCVETRRGTACCYCGGVRPWEPLP